MRALRSRVAPGGGGDAGEGGLRLGRTPLAQRRLLKDKLAGVVQDMAACLSCGKHGGDGDAHTVTIGSSSAVLWPSEGYGIDLLLSVCFCAIGGVLLGVRLLRRPCELNSYYRRRIF